MSGIRSNSNTYLIEGPFETDYSLAIVNRNLAYALLKLGQPIRLHQRDNTTNYAPGRDFLEAHPALAKLFVRDGLKGSFNSIHSRNIYPPFTDAMASKVRCVHCYAWEESIFPNTYRDDFNNGLNAITVTSQYVRQVLYRNGVRIPIYVVGNGADHILGTPPAPVDLVKDRFTFLHISSCFPRKAPDVLVDAFCKEFRSREDVQLVIKTFPNPHNQIDQIVSEACARYTNHAPIEMLQAPLISGQIRFLIENSDCIVSPSRGEGFGLPMAEAMLLGRPVIATLHGGQADLGGPESCWPVDFELVPAKTHLTEGRSLWAEPSVDSLRRQMRSVYQASSFERSDRTGRARLHIAANFTWEQVAKKHLDIWNSMLENDPISPSLQPVSNPVHHIGFISSWNTKCGIAEYTRYLAENLSPDCRYSVFADRATGLVRPDGGIAMRSWSQGASDPESRRELELLIHQIHGRGVDVVSLQYNFGLFRPSAVEYLRRELASKGIGLVVTLHSTNHETFGELARVLERCALTIVHRTADLKELKNFGVTRSEIQQQGIHAPAHIPARESLASKTRAAFTIACFGFFLPPKGILDLLQAFEAAARVNPVLRLKLLNSLYPAPSSLSYAAECVRFIQRRGLAGRVELCTDFLDDNSIVQGLSEADLIVLPYTHSSESSSAAIRLPLASLTPVLCSGLTIFDEFREVVHRYRAGDVFELANRIIDLSTKPSELAAFTNEQRKLVEQLSWPKTSAQFYKLVSQCGKPSQAASS